LRRIAVILALAVAIPGASSANETLNDFWAAIKDEWGYRPAAVIAAAPAFVVSAPFLLGKAAFEEWGGEGEEEAEPAEGAAGKPGEAAEAGTTGDEVPKDDAEEE
jgi:hypothetical protein